MFISLDYRASVSLCGSNVASKFDCHRNKQTLKDFFTEMFYCCCSPISLGICLNVINCTINENMFDFSSFLSAFFSSTYFRMFKELKSYKKCEYLRQCFYTSEINSTIPSIERFTTLTFNDSRKIIMQ